MKIKHKLAITSVVLLTLIGGGIYISSKQEQPIQSKIDISLPQIKQVSQLESEPCDTSLWDHVYHGKMNTAQDRLRIIEPCKTVTGTIANAVKEADGDWHIRFDPDDQSLINGYNLSGQKGHLVVEVMCANPVTQRDTNEEGVCNGFSQSEVFDVSMVGKRVSIIGVYIQDMEHKWNEIHPVTSIKIIN